MLIYPIILNSNIKRPIYYSLHSCLDENQINRVWSLNLQVDITLSFLKTWNLECLCDHSIWIYAFILIDSFHFRVVECSLVSKCDVLYCCSKIVELLNFRDISTTSKGECFLVN